MISVSNDIGKLPGEKSDNDLLSGSLTILDFSIFLKATIPNFHRHVTVSRETSVGKSITLLHEITHMAGKPFDSNSNVKDAKLGSYLHSLSLAIKANAARIEALYDNSEV